MTRFLFLILSIFYFSPLCGQDTQIYPIDELILDIDSFPFCINSVIDARADKTYIGTTLRGARKHTVKAVTKKSLSLSLDEVFYRFFDCNGSSTKPLSVRINKFFFYEVGKRDNSLSSFQINLTFLEKVDSGYLELCTIGRTIDTAMKRFDNAEKKKQAFEQGLLQCFLGLKNRARKGILHDKFILESNVNQLPKLELKSVRPRGVYLTYTDFMEGTPRTGKTYNFVIQKDASAKSDYDTHLIGWRSREMRTKSPWGVSDGTRDFIKILDKYFPVIQSSEGINVIAPRRKAEGSDVALPISGTFGSVGVSFLLTLEEDRTIELEEKIPIIYTIDPLTGGIEASNRKVPKQKKFEGDRIMIFVTQDCNQSFKIRIDRKELCTIQKDSYLGISSTSSFKNYLLEVELEGVKKSLTFMPANSVNNFFEISTVKSEPKIRRIKRKTEALYLGKVKNGLLTKCCSEK